MTANANTSLARRLRRQSNAPEVRAWEALRALRAQGYPVKRQFPIGSYIVDFAIPKAKLIIEIDGSIHGNAIVGPTTNCVKSICARSAGMSCA